MEKAQLLSRPADMTRRRLGLDLDRDHPAQDSLVLKCPLPLANLRT